MRFYCQPKVKEARSRLLQVLSSTFKSNHIPIPSYAPANVLLIQAVQCQCARGECNVGCLMQPVGPAGYI